MRRKIAVITGTRAEYSYLKPLISAIKDDSDLELMLYVTGMHLLKEYGYTIQEIIKDGFEIKRTIDMGVKSKNTDLDLAVSIGKGIIEFAKAFKEDKPDIVVVFGDRIEPFAATVAAVAMNIPVAHIGGGDVALGDIDDSLRHAITKLAHLHFTSTKLSKERVLKLGEEPWRVFHVGALCLDTILNTELIPKNTLFKKYNLPDKPFILVSYHPVTTEWKEAVEQIHTVLDAVITVAIKENMEVVVIYPNAYPGGYEMVEFLRDFATKYRNVHIFKNLPHIEYISLLSYSSVFVGNSSSGIIEAPSLGIPYVCVGIRQQGRERAKNVIDVKCDKEEIIKAIEKALYDKEFLSIVKRCESPYGDGKASKRIIDVLKKIKIDKKLLQKKMTY